MSRLTIQWVLSVGLWLGLVGGGSTVSLSAQKPQPEAKKDFSIATIRHDCAPWDGAAVTVYLSRQPQKCEAIPYPNVNLRIWKSIAEISGQTFMFPSDQLGAISWMKQPRNFTPVKSGLVRFEKASGAAPVKGEYDLVFKDGSTMRGTFQAEWCSQRFPCG